MVIYKQWFELWTSDESYILVLGVGYADHLEVMIKSIIMIIISEWFDEETRVIINPS